MRPGLFRDVSAATARAAGYSIPEKIPTFAEWQAAGSQTGAPVAPAAAASPVEMSATARIKLELGINDQEVSGW